MQQEHTLQQELEEVLAVLSLLKLLALWSKLSVHQEYALRQELQAMLTLLKLLIPPLQVATCRSPMRRRGPRCTSGTYPTTLTMRDSS